MKLLTPLLVTTLLAFGLAPGAHAKDMSADSGAIKSKLMEMENNWEAAYQKKDHATLAGMVADDFCGMTTKGKHRDKANVLSEMEKDGDTVTAAANKDMDVHVYAPNLATVYGISTEKGKDKSGKAFNRSYAWVDTWMERNGKWECIAEGVMQLPGKK
jgi:ketosteroid isomerase-like protein